MSKLKDFLDEFIDVHCLERIYTKKKVPRRYKYKRNAFIRFFYV